jgi:hypothetical protein
VSRIALALALAGAGLCACNWRVATNGDHAVRHGRYTGIGIYQPLPAWTRLQLQSQPGDPAAARLADDQAIIVVQDTVSGEVRACGDLSGYCIGMNPWKTPLAASQLAPVRLMRAPPKSAAAPETAGGQ